MRNNLLTVDNLSLFFSKEKKILSGVNLSLQQNEMLLLCGKNGSGKSMLLRALKGLIPIQKGTILLDGEDVSKKSKIRNREIGLVFQDTDTQIVGQSVYKDLDFGLVNIGLDTETRKKRIEEVSSLLSITHLLHTSPMNLSGGEKRRVALGGVLVMNPRIIFLDEPFANLDYIGITQVIESIIKLQQKGVSIIIATHEIEKIAFHCNSMLVLDRGVVVESGQIKEVLPKSELYGIRIPRVRGEMIPFEELTWRRV